MERNGSLHQKFNNLPSYTRKSSALQIESRMKRNALKRKARHKFGIPKKFRFLNPDPVFTIPIPIKKSGSRQPYFFYIQSGPKKWVFIIFGARKFIFLGVILCGESITRIPESWKCFPEPDSGKRCTYWSKNILIEGQGSVFKAIRAIDYSHAL